LSYCYYCIDFKNFFKFFKFYHKALLIKYYSLILALLLVCLFTLKVEAIEVVTHPQVAERSLTKSQLRRIYTMRQLRWSDDRAIIVFVLPNQHELHQKFAKERLQIFPYQLNRIWHKLTYSGLGVAPTIVQSEDELIQAVINTPGAIGYIQDSTLVKINQRKKQVVTVSMMLSQQDAGTEEEQRVSSKGVVNVVKIEN
jgi:ABC-type phosphate transport system substrate-binding protein